MPSSSEPGHIPWYSRLWYLRLLLELAAGAFVAVMVYLIRHGLEKPTGESITEGLIHALIGMLVAELAHTAHSLERVQAMLYGAVQEVQGNLHRLNECIRNDERIIVARTEPMEHRREISIIGVERLDSADIPAPLEPPSKNEQWAVTISMLRLDRLQDLLFSTEYLKHFLKLHEATKKQYRILIVNDAPRRGSEAAIRSFLQMSETLDIETYVYLKSEFYDMLGCLEHVPRSGKTSAKRVKQIMTGQPELSLMRDDSGVATPVPVTVTDNFKLRFREVRVVEFGPTRLSEMPINRIECVHKLMHVAIQEKCRKGLNGFSRVIGKSCANPWEERDGRLAFLKHI